MDPEPHVLIMAISGQGTKSCTCFLSGPPGSNGGQGGWSLLSFPAPTAVQALNGKLSPRKMAVSPLRVKQATIKAEARPTQTTKSQSSRVVRTGPLPNSPGVLLTRS